MTTESKVRHAQPAPLASYANYFEVGHNPFEFLIDFGQFRPETSDVTLHTRIAVGPVHAKLLARILHDAVGRYEADNGQISDLAEELDPLEAIMRSLPDFEQRAVKVRRDALASSIAAVDSNSTSKR
ncbi:MAG: DUF3467 domain-containing protein [Desulfobulbus sp.]|nr:MAG: DUF3467 domain-containing protein [Desulfobulbus sp.]